ncbi:Histone H3 (Lys4) methyltransferase complex, subunit CPS60/ASH2/BRE2 [Trachipleistophora hominis]|uniref:Histone H3 (Lys4) methyltransferase complex, subunit CPS60/ASH2/BRE2 n=1 Tax=Trachipleistophora hominis TaxID=72359 RepID=L7JYT1_TRAHO|nr:Histone H3 (Lys4) methyltransferase complex, subunit CPS60/ASH2/BRE2 [Trachipleistophora hominis]
MQQTYKYMRFRSTPNIHVETNGLTVSSAADNKSCLTNEAIEDNTYFEVLINKLHVRIGVAPQDYKLYGPLGLDGSYAFGSLKGYKYHKGVRNAYAHKLKENDVVGVLKVEHFLKFFVNGVDLGIAYDDLYGKEYFAALSFYGGGSVCVNFGPCFAYDSVIKYEGMY